MNRRAESLDAAGSGWFYILQLVPDLNPEWVKLGFAGHLRRRLREHRTAAPTCRYLRVWPCRRSWEVAAIASITREGCSLLRQESFICNNLERLAARAETFFAIMPPADVPHGQQDSSALFDLPERIAFLQISPKTMLHDSATGRRRPLLRATISEVEAFMESRREIIQQANIQLQGLWFILRVLRDYLASYTTPEQRNVEIGILLAELKAREAPAS